MHKWILLQLICFYSSLFAQVEERILIFMPPANHESYATYHDVFEKNKNDLITKAKFDKKSVHFVDASMGLPITVTSLPCIVYQNHIGEHIYQGRWNDFDRILNHIETSRYLAVQNELESLSNTAGSTNGKWKFVVPIKISDVSGSVPKDYDSKKFKENALIAILKGFSNIKKLDKIALSKTDRKFYFDFYPWVSESGELYLSAKIFSQFHCKKEIWFTKDTPIAGPYSSFKHSFEVMARRMEAALMVILSDFKHEDSSVAVSKEYSIKSYLDLGYSKPKAPEHSKEVFSGELPLSYKVSELKPVHAVFSFLAPNDYLSGRIKEITGSFVLQNATAIKNLSAVFVANMSSVTMGDEDLNETLGDKTMLYLEKFPKATITLSADQDEVATLKYGIESQFVLKGDLDFKGIKKNVLVECDAEPIINKGVPYLRLQAKFQMDVSSFGLEGAPGDSENKNDLAFSINLFLEGIETE